MSKQYKVILLTAVDNLGQAGDQKIVKKGFALNFLIPQGLAVPVNADTINRLSSIKKKEDKRLSELKKEVEGSGKAIDGLSITFEVATHDDGKLYGSIDAGDVVKALQEQHNIEVEKKILSLKNPIKEAGTTSVTATLHPEVTPVFSVIVEGKETEEQKKKRLAREAKEAQEQAEAEERAAQEAEADDSAETSEASEEVAEGEAAPEAEATAEEVKEEVAAE